jgi:CubicO group peptidase (beta-lactamase class C family)
MEVLGIAELEMGEVTPEILLGFNDPDVRAVGIPGGGGVSSAVALAAYYQALLHDRAGLWDPAVLAEGTARVHCDLPDPMLGHPSNRTLGLVLAGDDGLAALRGMGHRVSPRAFGHNGAAGQIAFADPESGISFAFCTSGVELNPLREARRTAAIATRAAQLVG